MTNYLRRREVDNWETDEKERKEQKKKKRVSYCLFVFVYMYELSGNLRSKPRILDPNFRPIYIYIHTHIHIYIYIYVLVGSLDLVRILVVDLYP